MGCLRVAAQTTGGKGSAVSLRRWSVQHYRQGWPPFRWAVVRRHTQVTRRLAARIGLADGDLRMHAT
jgi:hypothetical protein